MKKIKIGYFADGPWSHKAFNLLIDDPTIEIKFIVPRSDTKDQTLLNYSKKYKIDYYSNTNINSDHFFKILKKSKIDLGVSMSFNQIFKNKVANFPVLGTINCHAGKLPFYRGRNVLNWVLINDELDFGITVHYIDDGIDTGDIVLQRSFPITDNDNYNTLLNKAYNQCALILYDAIKLIQNNKQNRIKQNSINSVGFYCGIRKEGDELIDWNQSSRELFCFIRALCKPGPMATSYSNGFKIKIDNASLIENAPIYKSTVGQVVGITKRGFVIKTKDSSIEIFSLESNVNLKIGDRLK